MKIRNFTDLKAILFKNVTIKQTIFKNTFWLGIAEGISRVLRLILIIYIARILGATEYGKFAFALAFVSLFALFSDFGLPEITTRELSREREREKEYSATLSLKTLLSLGALILMLAVSFFVTSDPLIQKIIWILAVFIIINSFSEIIYAFLRARQRMEYEALGKNLQAVITTGFGFFVILNFPSVINLSYGYLFSSLVALILILLFFHFKIYRLSFSWDKSIWQKFLRMSWPLGLAAIFGTIYTYVDSVIMGHFGQITETGWYNAASQIVRGTLIPTILISYSFYPALSKFALSQVEEIKEKFQKVWNYYLEITIILALPLVTGGIVLAPKIISFIYDLSFTPSIFAFQILIVMAGIIFLHNPFNLVLTTSNQQKKIFWIALAGILTNIILNLILIPRFSLYGAAFAALVTHLLILILAFKFTFEFTSISIKSLNLKFLLIIIEAGLSSLVMYLVISHPRIYSLNLLISILIGALIYIATLFLLKTWLRYFRFSKTSKIKFIL